MITAGRALRSRVASVPDSHVYHSVGLSADGLQLFINALRYYADRLESDITALGLDPLLAGVVDEKALRSFQITSEIKELRTFADRFQKMVQGAEDWGDAETSISHGLVRRLKAVAQLYLSELEARRDAIASARTLTALGLEALDTRLTQWREKLEMGVFKSADPLPLVISAPAALPSQATVATPVPSPSLAAPATAQAPAPVTIGILDPELRERCLDLFNVFDETNQTHRFDTVISEATRILEDRVRKRAGLGVDLIGMDLMSAAFGTTPPKLQMSSVDNEQKAAHLLFRGAVGFIRNPVQHQLLSQLHRDRVLQILGYIDYLLYLTATATKL